MSTLKLPNLAPSPGLDLLTTSYMYTLWRQVAIDAVHLDPPIVFSFRSQAVHVSAIVCRTSRFALS